MGYKTDLKKIREVLHDIIEKEDLILEEPQPSITVKELGDKGVKIEAGVWVRYQDYLEVKVRMNEEIKERLYSEEDPLP